MKEFVGVRWVSQNQKWKSYVTKNGVDYACGYFKDQRAAVKARDRKIIALGLDVKLQILKRKI